MKYGFAFKLVVASKMQIMKKFSYSEKLYYKAIAKLLIVPAIMLLLGVGFFVFGIENAIALGVPLAGMIGFVLGFVFYPVNLRAQRLMDKLVDPIYEKYYEGALTEERDAAKRGMDGERIVFGWLDEILTDKAWKLLKNPQFTSSSGGNFDIDAVVVGPRGIFVLEIKNSSYDFLFTANGCAVLAGEQYRLYAGTDPRIQVGQNAETIEQKLKTGGLGDIRVKRAVVFARTNSMRYLGKPTVYLIDNKDSLRKYLLDSPEDPRFTPDFCEKARRAISST